MPIQYNQTVISIVLAVFLAGVQIMFPSHKLVGFVLIVIALFVFMIFGVNRERRPMTTIGIIPILWILLGTLILIGGTLVVSHGINLAWPPTKKEVKADTPPILQLPSTGNLKQRAIALSDEIMNSLYEHGWPQRSYPPQQKRWSGHIVQQMPPNSDDILKWSKSRSNYFMAMFFKKVLDLRNEFAQLHLRDQRLDDFFMYKGYPG